MVFPIYIGIYRDEPLVWEAPASYTLTPVRARVLARTNFSVKRKLK